VIKLPSAMSTAARESIRAARAGGDGGGAMAKRAAGLLNHHATARFATGLQAALCGVRVRIIPKM